MNLSVMSSKSGNLRRKNMNFDLVVIGGGPAGEKGAAQAAYFGFKVALIDNKKNFGGTVNESAFMVKYLRKAALLSRSLKNNDLYDLSKYLKNKIDLDNLLKKTEILSNKFDLKIRNNIYKHKISIFNGTATFINKNEVCVTRDCGSKFNIKSEIFIICTGSKQLIPSWYNESSDHLITSWNVKKLNHLPEEITIIGGGMIGCEYASIFSYLGSEVNLIHSGSSILSNLDVDISDCLTKNLLKNKVNFLLKERVLDIKLNNDIPHIKCESGKEIRSKMVLLSLGNIGNTSSLNLDVVGIEVSDHQHIIVNEYYQTSCPNIYAAGDVIGFPSLASTSMEQARVAVVHAFDLKYKKQLNIHFPKGIYTIPEIGYVGDSEETLKQKNTLYVKGKCDYEAIAGGYLVGEELGFLKILVDQSSQKILGVQIVGKSATELIHFGTLLVANEMHVNDIISTCFNFPSLHELYKYAAYDALGQLNL